MAGPYQNEVMTTRGGVKMEDDPNMVRTGKPPEDEGVALEPYKVISHPTAHKDVFQSDVCFWMKSGYVPHGPMIVSNGEYFQALVLGE